MDWSEIAAFWRRRRLLTLFVVVGTLVAGGVTLARVPPDYTSQGEVLLLPPSAVVGRGGNPFLSLDRLTPIGDVLATSLNSKAKMDELALLGATAEYTVTRDLQSPAPMVLIEVTGAGARETMRTLAIVMDSVGPGLDEVQRDVGVPGIAYVTLTEVTRSSEPERSLKSPIRAVIVISGGVFALLFGVTFLLDVLRRPQRAGSDNDDPPSTQTAEVAGTGLRGPMLAQPEEAEGTSVATVGSALTSPSWPRRNPFSATARHGMNSKGKTSASYRRGS